MADERNEFGRQKDADKKSFDQKKSQQSALDDLDAGTDEIEKVKGGRMSDPCEGGELR
jgi:hypothetical protein